MSPRAQNWPIAAIFRPFWAGLTAPLALLACDGAHSQPGAAPSATPAAVRPRAQQAPAPLPSASTSARPTTSAFQPTKVDVQVGAMATSVHFIAYTTPSVDESRARDAIDKAIAEMRRLESILSEWQPDTQISQVNRHPGEWVSIGPEALRVIERGLWAGRLSGGAFDVTFQALSQVWKFGSAMEEHPKPPSRAQVEPLRKRIDFRRVELDEAGSRVRIGKDQQLGLGGISKGYIVDQAARVLHDGGLEAFLVQAGGDLYGSGRKPDGSPWVSGVRDPRGSEPFAFLELEDHAFSTAGDYARSYVVDGKRYHHIIDPKTGFPATACRSVTIWAPDATTADGLDDAVFILGPQRGLELVESTEGVGAVIVDSSNHVFVSDRVKEKVKVARPPTDAP
jgi:FAD:protein FMN transferase